MNELEAVEEPYNMKSYLAAEKDVLKQELELALQQYETYKGLNLKLDMSRGKPGAKQLELSEHYLTCVSNGADCISQSGTDCRNYGGLDGLPEMKALFADLLDVGAENVIVGGNSSLNMMFDTVVREMVFGNVDSEKPWGQLEQVKFLCPVPGYDRHFFICQTLGIEMINVPMNADGPDMDLVEELVAKDASIKGIWCVPKYSNPDGISYSDEVVRRLATMKTAAKDFRIMYDNAYVIHHLYDEGDSLLNLFTECEKAGNPNRIYMFASTSKIVYPGAGVSAMIASKENVAAIKKILGAQTIGPDKLNQLRHIRFFQNKEGVLAHMKKHAEIIRPKFEAVWDILESQLGGTEIATWTKTNGGYFISFFAMEGCAKEIERLAKECGVTITPAGATYPYGKDPADSNIRIAPTFPSTDDLRKALEVFCVCVKIASIRKLLEK